jgi:hypothetical protein
MPYGIKKILEMDAERKRRREEKARIKAEKEKLKKEERRKARQKRLKKKQNQRYQAKVRKARDTYHKSIGDEKGVFTIYLFKNGKRFKYIGHNLYKVAAMQRYYKILAENNEKVQFKQEYSKAKHKLIKNKYELILVKRLDVGDIDNVTLLRNDEGKFVGNYFVDSPTHKILDKNEWLVEETFNVYGFDPQKDRKDFSYILNNIILNGTDKYTRIFVYSNKLIHHYDDDFDMVICKDAKQAIALYDKIEKMVDHKKYKNLFFMGKIRSLAASWFIDELEAKTGWSREKCKR